MKKLVNKPVGVLSAGATVLALLLAGCNGHQEAVSGGGSNNATLPPDVQFTITPKRVPVNGVAILDWKVLNATADTTCQASGAWGSNDAAAPSPRPVESSHGPYTDANPAPAQVKTSQSTAGNYDYILSCTGPGGTTHVVQRLIVGGPAMTLTLTPAAIQPGETTTLHYAVEGLESTGSCTATGAAGYGWPVDQNLPLPSGDIVLGRVENGSTFATGAYPFGLSCKLNSATDAIAYTTSTTLNVGNVSSLPKLKLQALDAQIAPGDSASLIWSLSPAQPNAHLTCKPSGATVANWSGTLPATKTEPLVVGPFNNHGEYTLTLTCSGVFDDKGTATSSDDVVGVVSSVVTIFVFNSYCDGIDGNKRVTLLNQSVIPTASFSTASGDTCLLPVCGVSDPGGAIDDEADLANEATFTNLSLPISLGLLGDTVSYTVSAAPDVAKINLIDGTGIDRINQCEFANDNLFGRPADATCPTGITKVGFVISNPDALLTLALLKNVTVVTSLVHGDGRPTEGGDSDPDSRLDIDLLTILTGGPLPIDENREKLYLAEVVVKKPANTVKLELSNDVAGLLSEINVHNVCVSFNTD